MDNLNELQKALLGGEQAVDDYLGNVGSLEFISHIETIQYPSTTEFTKIEQAALMIAQGVVCASEDYKKKVGIGYGNSIARHSVEIAKTVLEEANK